MATIACIVVNLLCIGTKPSRSTTMYWIQRGCKAPSRAVQEMAPADEGSALLSDMEQAEALALEGGTATSNGVLRGAPATSCPSSQVCANTHAKAWTCYFHCKLYVEWEMDGLYSTWKT